MSERVFRAWRANAEVNQTLLAHLTPGMLGVRMPGDGWTVARVLAHMQSSAKRWAARLDPERLAPIPLLFGEDEDGREVPETDLDAIRDAFARTAVAVRAAVGAAAGARGELPHADGEALMAHMLAHDAHHRGQILLALKAAGHPLPEEEPMWAPWRSGP